MKKADVDSIGIPMLIPRQPQFKNLPQYKEDRSYDEPEQTIYITSNRFRSEWFNTLFNKTFVGYFRDKLNKHRIMCIDIFSSLKHGLKTPQWYFAQKESMDELSFDMEVLNLTAGEANGAYYSWEMFRKNQTIKNAFYPPSLENLANKIKSTKPKKDDEIRLITIDFSWVGDYKGHKNDNTVIICSQLKPKDDYLIREVEYLETHSGSDAVNMPLRIKEMFWDYGATYIVLDMRSAGEMLFNELSKPMPHPYRSDDDWNEHGFTIGNEDDLHFVKTARLEEIRGKVVDKYEAIPCIIPITASNDLNSNMWLDLAKRLNKGEIRFLIDELEFETNLNNKGEWINYSSEEKAELKMPYAETLLMINEAVNLTQKWSNGLLKLSEPTTGTKDSIVALGYMNLFASKLFNKMEREKQEKSTVDVSKWKMVF